MRELLDRELLERVAVIARFGTVGVLATATYFFASLALLELSSLHANAVNVAAFIVSIAVSYIGHHQFTFRAQGAHGHHLTRFLIITAILFSGSNLLIWSVVERADYAPIVGTTLVTVLYPVLSFLLHNTWTFAAARSSRQRAAQG